MCWECWLKIKRHSSRGKLLNDELYKFYSLYQIWLRYTIDDDDDELLDHAALV